MSTTEIATKAKEYKELTQFIKQLEAEVDTLKQAMIAELGAQGTDTITTDLFTIRWTEYQTSRLDSTKLKAEQAEIYSLYTKTTTAKRFQIA